MATRTGLMRWLIGASIFIAAACTPNGTYEADVNVDFCFRTSSDPKCLDAGTAGVSGFGGNVTVVGGAPQGGTAQGGNAEAGSAGEAGEAGTAGSSEAGSAGEAGSSGASAGSSGSSGEAGTAQAGNAGAEAGAGGDTAGSAGEAGEAGTAGEGVGGAPIGGTPNVGGNAGSNAGGASQGGANAGGSSQGGASVGGASNGGTGTGGDSVGGSGVGGSSQGGAGLGGSAGANAGGSSQGGASIGGTSQGGSAGSGIGGTTPVCTNGQVELCTTLASQAGFRICSSGSWSVCTAFEGQGGAPSVGGAPNLGGASQGGANAGGNSQGGASVGGTSQGGSAGSGIGGTSVGGNAGAGGTSEPCVGRDYEFCIDTNGYATSYRVCDDGVLGSTCFPIESYNTTSRPNPACATTGVGQRHLWMEHVASTGPFGASPAYYTGSSDAWIWENGLGVGQLCGPGGASNDDLNSDPMIIDCFPWIPFRTYVDLNVAMPMAGAPDGGKFWWGNIHPTDVWSGRADTNGNFKIRKIVGSNLVQLEHGTEWWLEYNPYTQTDINMVIYLCP